MPRFSIAHRNEQGQELIIVPLDKSFDYKAQSEKDAIIRELQMRAGNADLRGTVVPVWQSSGGRMAFIAPRPWWPYFRGLTLSAVSLMINRELYW
jgi:hypothetical protein